jgi:hypothetical protein
VSATILAAATPCRATEGALEAGKPVAASVAPFPRISRAADELVWAFKACDEAFQTDIDPTKRASLMDDYRFRRGRALGREPHLASATRIHTYNVRSMLSRCDAQLPKFAAKLQKKQAMADVEAALSVCREALASGNTSEIDAKYEQFKELSQRARSFDQSIAQNKELGARLSSCEAELTVFVKKRHDVEATALARYRVEASKKAGAPTEKR